jgi:hypothetical protein
MINFLSDGTLASEYAGIRSEIVPTSPIEPESPDPTV